MKGLSTLIEESKQLANWIGDQIDGLPVKSDDRMRLSAGLINLSIAHHSGVVQLFDCRRFASALALVRPMIDSLVRSQWLVHLASDQEVQGFLDGDDPPSTLKIIQKLECEGFYDQGRLSAVVTPIWPAVCDFNHGGGRIVSRHLTADAVEPNFTDDELAEVLRAADSWALVSACALADLVGDRKLGEALVQHGKGSSN